MSAPALDLCLEFANTRFWRGTPAPTETLHCFNDLLSWALRVHAFDSATQACLANWADGHPSEALSLFEQSVSLRETIYALFEAMTVGRPPASPLIDTLNQRLAETPHRGPLLRGEQGYVLRLPPIEPNLAHMLAPVLWSAADLLVSSQFDRIRRCANEKCLWLFLDSSKGGTRRWCSMSACGNRAKAHRHYAKKREKIF